MRMGDSPFYDDDDLDPPEMIGGGGGGVGPGRYCLPRLHHIKGQFRYIAWVKCPYRVADKASALRAGERGKAGARLNAHIELLTKRPHSAH